MVLKKADKRLGRKGQHVAGRRAPNRRAHGNKEAVSEPFAGGEALDELGQRRVPRLFEHEFGGAEKSHDVGQHAKIAGGDHVLLLREDTCEGTGAEFKLAVAVADAKRHVAWLGGDG